MRKITSLVLYLQSLSLLPFGKQLLQLFLDYKTTAKQIQPNSQHKVVMPHAFICQKWLVMSYVHGMHRFKGPVENVK